MRTIILPFILLAFVLSSAGQQPATAEDYFKRANTALDKGEYDSAIADYTQAIRLRPVAWGAYNNRGKAYQKRGDLNAAVADHSEAIRLKPDLADAFYERGLTHLNLEQLDKALEDCRRSIELNPAFADAHVVCRLTLHAKKELDAAIIEFESAIELDAKNANAYGAIGDVLIDREQFREAAEMYTKAIAIQPDLNRAYIQRGWANYNLGNLSLALLDYNRAIKTNSTTAELYYLRGIVYRDQKKPIQAAAEMRRALKIDPDYEDARNELAQLSKPVRKGR